MTRIIGLAGAAQSGKDTAGAMLGGFGYKRLAFADALKDLAISLDPEFEYGGKPWSLTRLVELYGWEDVKRYVPASRIYLQHKGAELRREDPEHWIKKVFAQVHPGGQYVICDVRYPNEVAAILAAGGIVAQVQRPGLAAVNEHISETALEGFEFNSILRNTSTMAVLRRRVELMRISFEAHE